MCGRFTLKSGSQKLAEAFPLFEAPELEPRYNIAPTQQVAAARILPDGPKQEIVLLHWGLIPSWADDPSIGNRLINARAETVAEKPSFRSAFRKRRCLVLADGFFEWQKVDGKKQPYYFQLKDNCPFAFAGLWEHWERVGKKIESGTILTTAANDLLRNVHDRMPVILHPADYERWLDPDNQTGKNLDKLLCPFPAEEMQSFPVSTHVNNPRNDDPRCVEPLVQPDFQIDGSLFES
jgi:putative SOS response-associated peptidase YedK